MMIGFHFPIKLSQVSAENSINGSSSSSPSVSLPEIIKENRKRIIFISIVQLNLCIDNVPAKILQESLFCFKADRTWFFPSNMKERQQAQFSIAGKIDCNSKILKCIYQKDKLGQIMWLSEEKTWKDISDQLQKIPDIYQMLPTTTKKHPQIFYSPLILDVSWWQKIYAIKNSCFFADGTFICITQINIIDARISLFILCLLCVIKADSVIAEISSGELRFQPAMELLFQSNRTLIPMRTFYMNIFLNFHEQDINNNIKENEGEMMSKLVLIAYKNSFCNQEEEKKAQQYTPSYQVQQFDISSSHYQESEEFEMIELPMDYKVDSIEFNNAMKMMMTGMNEKS